MIKVTNTNTHTVAYYNELTFGKAKYFLAQCLLQQFFLEQHLLSPKKSDIDRLNEIGRQSRDFSHGKDSPSILQNATIKIQIKGVNTNDKREKATLIPK